MISWLHVHLEVKFNCNDEPTLSCFIARHGLIKMWLKMNNYIILCFKFIQIWWNYVSLNIICLIKGSKKGRFHLPNCAKCKDANIWWCTILFNEHLRLHFTTKLYVVTITQFFASCFPFGTFASKTVCQKMLQKFSEQNLLIKYWLNCFETIRNY